MILTCLTCTVGGYSKIVALLLSIKISCYSTLEGKDAVSRHIAEIRRLARSADPDIALPCISFSKNLDTIFDRTFTIGHSNYCFVLER